eukprot:gene456-448_t
MGKGGRKGGNKKKFGHRGGDKRVSGAEAVKARNRAAERAEQEEDDDDVEEDSEVEEQEEFKKEKPKGVSHLLSGMSLNEREVHHVDKDGIQMTRRQKEELAKQKRERLYREKHKRGETEEAQNDLARLKAVKERREAAAKAKKEGYQEEKWEEGEKWYSWEDDHFLPAQPFPFPLVEAAAVEAAETAKRAVGQEYRDALGSEAARLRGARSAATKAKKAEGYANERGAGNDRDMYVAYANAKPTIPQDDHPTAAAKAAEEDFIKAYWPFSFFKMLRIGHTILEWQQSQQFDRTFTHIRSSGVVGRRGVVSMRPVVVAYEVAEKS